jgi:DNA-binding LacI/PurR family transcriptional regulator
MKRVTIKELAKVLNLSPSTVSRALSDHPDISKATKEKVREASKMFNYSPNLRARYLRTKSSGLIALILPEYFMFFIPEMMKTISDAVGQKGYSLMVFQSDNSYIKELNIINNCNQLCVDGILLSISSGFQESNELLELNRDGAPIVLLDRTWVNEEMSSVGIDGAGVAYEAVQYLFKKGHKKIGGLFASYNHRMSERRQSGFEKACKENEMQINALNIDSPNDFDKQLSDFLESHKSITALFTMTDELMIKCHSGLQRLGFRIPEDMSLISISDGVLVDILTPKITHLFHSPIEIGKKSVELLFERIEDKMSETKSLKVECKLVEYESVKDLN